MTARTTTPTRRRKGEGSISRHHTAPKCPPVGPDGSRPEHDCTGLFQARINVKTATGKTLRKVLYGKTEGEVLGKLRKLIATEGNYQIVEKSITLSTWVDRWFADAKRELKVNTHQGYANRIEKWIKPELGSHRLDKLQPEHVTALYDKMRREGLTEGSVRQVHAILRRCLKMAMRTGLVARNVASSEFIDPPKTATQPRKPLSVEQAWKVLAVAGMKPRAAMALMTGLRQGEVLALRWMDIYLDGSEDIPFPHLVVRRSRSYETGVGYVYGTPKSAKSTGRVVPLIGYVRDRLLKLHEEASGGGPLSPEALVLVNSRRNPIDANTDATTWNVLLEQAGVPYSTLHSARNTTAALLESAGVPARVVAEILGHASVAMTYRYQAGNASAVQAAMLAFDTFMSEAERTHGKAS